MTKRAFSMDDLFAPSRCTCLECALTAHRRRKVTEIRERHERYFPPPPSRIRRTVVADRSLCMTTLLPRAYCAGCAQGFHSKTRRVWPLPR